MKEYKAKTSQYSDDTKIDTSYDPAYQIYFIIANLNNLFASFPTKIDMKYYAKIDRLLSVAYIMLYGPKYDKSKKHTKSILDHTAFLKDELILSDSIYSFFDKAMLKFEFIISLCEINGIWFDLSTTADIDEDI